MIFNLASDISKVWRLVMKKIVKEPKKRNPLVVVVKTMKPKVVKDKTVYDRKRRDRLDPDYNEKGMSIETSYIRL